MVVALSACGSTTYEERDPNLAHASSLDGGPNRDAGAVVTAKPDAGTQALDAGAPRDAGLASPPDAGSGVDAGLKPDAGQPPGDACSPLTCSGCCSAGVCQQGQSTASCGNNGVACTACRGTDRCGTAQACELDPTATWLVQPTAAVLTDKSWDLTSDPDPKLTLWCPATRAMPNGASPKVSDTYTPTWSTGGCTASAADLVSGGFGFTAVDVDLSSDDEVCPFTTIAISEAQLRAGRIDVPAMCGLKSLTVALQKQ